MLENVPANIYLVDLIQVAICTQFHGSGGILIL